MEPLQVHTSFREGAREARNRRRRRRIKRYIAFTGMLGLSAVCVFILFNVIKGSNDETRGASVSTDEEVFVQVEGADTEAKALAAARLETFLDTRGDPMILVLPSKQERGIPLIVDPIWFDSDGAPLSRRIGQTGLVRLHDLPLLRAENRLNLTLPSTSSDLAAFEVLRRGARASPVSGSAGAQSAVARGTTRTVDADEIALGKQIEGVSQERAEIRFTETTLSNTTTEAFVVPNRLRQPMYKDVFHVLVGSQSSTDVLIDMGVDEAQAKRVGPEFLKFLPSEYSIDGVLPKGSFVAVRLLPNRTEAIVANIVLRVDGAFQGGLLQERLGVYVSGGDPWSASDSDLTSQVDSPGLETLGGAGRLVDAIYSVFLRLGKDPGLAGELLVMLSRSADLDRAASSKDRLVVLLSENMDAPSLSTILYVGVTGPGTRLSCYIMAQENGEFDCARAGRGSAFAFPVPVAGIRSVGFGPYYDEVYGQTRMHAGIDWRAPLGTPVHAIADGQVTFMAADGGFGNVIIVNHGQGAESRYAHLDRFGPAVSNESRVRARDVIGYVGSTGISTGPHLHFELRLNGVPIDPRLWNGVGGKALPSSTAVDALVSRIIQVESAGDARAKNARSTATGLGQFIDSTWLRMMAEYRPDLVRQHSKAELLNLRYDPTISREMTQQYARENEAFLLSRGHQITPGRLYLAHFLGAGGANIALRADPVTPVVDAMGEAVVNANRFLVGKDIRWLHDWADKKMSSVSKIVEPPPPDTPEVRAYKEAIDALILTR